MSRTPYHFFLAHAGYSYDPRTETPMQGRIRCAQQLARAEKTAHDRGCSFEWMIDRDIDSSEFSNERPSWSLWGCVARDERGAVFASLWAIDFGRDRDPWGDPYRRVVEAELACELPDEDDENRPAKD